MYPREDLNVQVIRRLFAAVTTRMEDRLYRLAVTEHLKLLELQAEERQQNQEIAPNKKEKVSAEESISNFNELILKLAAGTSTGDSTTGVIYSKEQLRTLEAVNKFNGFISETTGEIYVDIYKNITGNSHKTIEDIENNFKQKIKEQIALFPESMRTYNFCESYLNAYLNINKTLDVYHFVSNNIDRGTIYRACFGRVPILFKEAVQEALKNHQEQSEKQNLSLKNIIEEEKKGLN